MLCVCVLCVVCCVLRGVWCVSGVSGVWWCVWCVVCVVRTKHEHAQVRVHVQLIKTVSVPSHPSAGLQTTRKRKKAVRLAGLTQTPEDWGERREGGRG